MRGSAAREVTVWDPLVRIGHWLLVAGFAVAYVTSGPPPQLHVWAGYLVGAIVLLRVVWGFAGPPHARFRNFVHSPGEIFSYLRDLPRRRARRHLGHSPAGGAMAIALLLGLALTAGTGLLAYGEEKGAGPLAFLFPAPPVPAAADLPLFPSLDDAEPVLQPGAGQAAGDRSRSRFGELHELFGNLTLLLIVLHICGVVLASFAHRENLVRAMISGRKRAP